MAGVGCGDGYSLSAAGSGGGKLGLCAAPPGSSPKSSWVRQRLTSKTTILTFVALGRFFCQEP